MEAIRSELERLKEIETQLSSKAWNSPRGLVDNDNDNTLLIQRYEQARDLYLQRRLENLLVDHISTYQDGEFEMPELDETEDEALRERHAQAVAQLEASMETIQSRVQEWQLTQEKVKSRREELERMLQDMQGDDDDDDSMMDNDEEEVDESAIQAEQARMEELQQRKIQLQEKLAKLQADTEQAQKRAQVKQEQVQALQEQKPEGAEEFQKKIEELIEMKVFYDSLREVLEELGGVKILKVEENPVQRHLVLTLAFYDDYQVQVELAVYRKVFLKLVSATWISEPVVRSTAASLDTDSTKDDFFLSMDPLEDLVQVAKTTLGPPHDLRFVVRETLARIRMAQDRVEELALLRRHVLTKVHSGNQVVCSLNDGIIIVMRIYEKFLKLEQIVGVGGWDDAITSQLHTNVTLRIEKELPQDDCDVLLHGSKVTPMIMVQFVQEELQKMQSAPGWVDLKTPRFPARKGGLSVDTTTGAAMYDGGF